MNIEYTIIQQYNTLYIIKYKITLEYKMIASKLVLMGVLLMGICSSRLVQSDCILCMSTYKVNCTICYNTCSSNKEMTECSTYNGSSRNYLSADTCLGTCCPSFSASTPFTEPNFNLCIERDVYTDKTINIGLTLGLILGLLLFPLFLAGFAYEFGILWFDDKVLEQKQQTIPVTNQDLGTIRSNPTENAISSQGKPWQTDGMIVNGICPICSKDHINTVAHCNHGFHYQCLQKSRGSQNICPLCKLPASLSSAKVYCKKCREQYKSFITPLQLFNSKTINELSSKFKCPKCK